MLLLVNLCCDMLCIIIEYVMFFCYFGLFGCVVVVIVCVWVLICNECVLLLLFVFGIGLLLIVVF